MTPDVDALARLARGRPPVGAVRLVTIDGRSGAGKSTLASRLAAALGGASLVAMDDLYPGWDGLAAAVDIAVDRVARPLVAGRAARWRRWDWAADAPGPWTGMPWAPVVVLEGCGAGAAALRPFAATALWLDVPAAERLRRLRARPDWPQYAPHHAAWAAQEAALHAVDPPWIHADAVVRP